MASIIQIRRDTSTNWTSANPVLAQGELGVETNTLKFKCGNGTSAWNSLSYLIDTGGYLSTSDIGTLVQAYDADLSQWAGISTTSKQDTLVSGTSIKTVNSSSLLGSGNLAVGDVTLTGTETLTNKTLTTPTLNAGYTEQVYAISGTTPALSPTNGSIQTWTLTANSTPTAGTWAAGQSVTLMVNDTASSFTVTWTSMPVTWVGGSAPTLAPGGGFTVIALWKVGTTIYGASIGQVA